MQLMFNAEEIAFRDEVRHFVNAHFPTERPYRGTQADKDRWAAALFERGWAAYKWPVEHGGTGWNATQKFIWERETSTRGIPAQLGGMGMFMLAPVLYSFGSAEQCERHLPGILRNEVEWCQGYSEPGSGSDLAALRTRAERVGGDYVVNGEKVWTSWAHIAHWMFCLVRTSTGERRQDGITFLLIDMKTPGIAVHPIPTIDGKHHLNRVTFDDVRVPVANRVGEEGKGWTYAKGLLTHERTGLAHVSESMRLLGLLKGLAKDPALIAKIAAADVELTALAMTELRTLAEAVNGAAPGAQSSILKLKGTQVIQRVTELFVECAGHFAIPWLPERATPGTNVEPVGPDWAQEELCRYMLGRSASIAGGTDEVQRNIIAKHVLQL
ncbi:MAG: acyl-CoA dehydrogenase family protein [Alphaproteobacteria bacterium]|nr:acyl-CoA dehydrogenase family protein [Alphaproteobacteria bacterium]